MVHPEKDHASIVRKAGAAVRAYLAAAVGAAIFPAYQAPKEPKVKGEGKKATAKDEPAKRACQNV